MANVNDIADALESLGAKVPDRAAFAQKMTDPKYAETVRGHLKDAGATVSDSASFYKKFGTGFPSGAQSSVKAKSLINPEAEAARKLSETKYAAGGFGSTMRLPIAAVTAPVVGAWNTLTGSVGNLNNFSLARYKANMADYMRRASQNEGAPGLITDPLNFAGGAAIRVAKEPFVAGAHALQATRFAPAVASTTRFATSHPWLTHVGSGVGEGAYLGTVGGMLNRGQASTQDALDGAQYGLGALAREAAVGGILGGAGRGLSFAGEAIYPHRQHLLTEAKAKYGDASEAAMEQAMRDNLARTGFLGGQGRYIDAADANRALIGKEYGEALGAIPESRSIPYGLEEELGAPWNLIDNYEYPRSVDPRQYAQAIREQAEGLRVADLQGNVTKAVPSSNLRKALEKRAADFEQDLLAQKRKYGHTPDWMQNDLFGGTDLIDIKDVSKLRNKYTQQYSRGVTRKETVQQAADELMHDAIVGKITRDNPEYAAYLAERNTPQRYAIAARLAKQALVDTKVPQGLLRFGPLPALNNYRAPSMLYSGGKLLSSGAGVQAGTRLTDLLFMPSATDTTR